MKPFLCIAGAVCVGATAAAADPADRLLLQTKDAAGGAAIDRLATWHERGTLTAGGGLTGDYERWVDLKTGHGAEHTTVGPAASATGWDGTRAWSSDSSGQVRMESSGGALAEARQAAYRSSWAFWFPDRWPAQRRYMGVRRAGGATFDVVRITPAGAEPFEIWIDRKSHLIRREVQVGGAHPQSHSFGDFRRVAGVMMPFETRDGAGDPRLDTITHATFVEADRPIPAERLRPPESTGGDVVWPEGQTSVTAPFTLLSNHIYVDVSINGRPAEPFIFDTGAVGLLDARRTAALGVTAAGALPSGGFGEAVVPAGIGKVDTVDLHGLRLDSQIFYAMDLRSLDNVEGMPAAGLVGYEFAQRAVTTIDYQRHLLTFTRPEAFLPPPGAVAVPLAFEAHTPVVTAMVDGVTGEFEIDTGARGSLTLMRPFVEAHGLMEKYRPAVEAVTGYGVGGPAHALLARVRALSIGSLTIRTPVTNFEQGTRGAAASTRLAGNIGGGILKRFTLTLDYGHQRLYLRPNAAFDSADVYDRSGLWITQAALGGFEIGDVVPASPASKAGLAVGERILEIDGTAAASLGITAVRECFKAPPGTDIRLRIAGRGGEREVTVTLAELV